MFWVDLYVSDESILHLPTVVGLKVPVQGAQLIELCKVYEYFVGKDVRISLSQWLNFKLSNGSHV